MLRRDSGGACAGARCGRSWTGEWVVPACGAAAVAAVALCSTTTNAAAAAFKRENPAIAALSERHPQDGPHCDLKFRLDGQAFSAEISMNLVFLD